MNTLQKITFEPPYRQLEPAARVFVDDLVARIEKASEVTGRPMFELLGEYEPTAREFEHLQRALTRAAVFDRVRDLTEAQNVSARRIVKEVAAIAFSSIDHYRRPDAFLEGGVFELEYATPEQRAAVKEVKVEESVRTGNVKMEIKLHDKLAALRMLGQIQGLFNGDGDPINPDKWAEAGGIPTNATSEEAADQYARFIDGE